MTVPTGVGRTPFRRAKVCAPTFARFARNRLIVYIVYTQDETLCTWALAQAGLHRGEVVKSIVQILNLKRKTVL